VKLVRQLGGGEGVAGGRRRDAQSWL